MTPPWTGSFSKSGSPILKIKIGGPLPGSEQEFEAIIDTGFTGFVSMPIVQAFPLGLLLTGTTSVTLADGKSAYNLTAAGIVTVAGESQTGIVLLQSSACDILLGMDFLRKFGRGVFIHQQAKIVALYHEQEFLDLVTRLAAAAPPASAQPAAPSSGEPAETETEATPDTPAAQPTDANQ